MSVINTMLKELDRRDGLSAPDGTLPPQHVRVVGAKETGREWFWRIVAGLMVIAIAWLAWVAYQLQPRPLATDRAFQAAEEARGRILSAAAAPPAAPSTPATAVAPAPAQANLPVAQPAETLKLARTIDTPLDERPRPAPQSQNKSLASAEAPRTSAAVASQATKARPSKLDVDVPPARILPPPALGATRVNKREHAYTAAQKAEAEFRRAVALLNQARVSEAAEALSAALAADPSHEAARQTLVALNLENRRIDEARRLLQEGLVINPNNAAFASVLARIFVERRELDAALDTLNGARGGARGNAEYFSLLGTVLQRLGRHREAVEAYQSALAVRDSSAQAWVGLGISLEALEQRPAAADAFRRALALGPVNSELKNFVEQRLRALH